MELIYEIARYGTEVGGDLIERAQLWRREDATLLQRVADGPENALLEGDAVAAIGADPVFAAVSADHDTKIIAAPEVAADLPLALTVHGGQDIISKDEWLLTVNDEPWAAFPTADGTDRFLPLGGDDEVCLAPEWATLSFIETGSMVSGYDVTSIGMATASLVVGTSRLDPLVDSPEYPSTIWRRGENVRDDAEMILTWLTDNPLEDYLGISPTMLVQLFIEATLNDPDELRAWHGNYLAAGIGPTNEVGTTETSEWTLSLNITPEVAAAVLDAISGLGPQMADRVTAARDPESPAGVARQALLQDHGL